ncbi:hypothetical protein CsSME_00027325 [Camellia sinensis var. sinensis]
MVEEILEKFPNVATTFDENGRNLAQLKDRILYDHLKKTVNHVDRMMADYKKDHFPRDPFGPVNRMTWDVFWFKLDMIVSTIIGTVNYATLFTIPSGFDQENGLPIFFTKAINGQQDLQLFMSYIGGSLVASLSGLGTQLLVQLSWFNSNDFHISLPLKFFIATASLFYDAFINSYFGVMWLAGILMTLVYADALDLTYDYYYIICYSLAYKSQKM